MAEKVVEKTVKVQAQCSFASPGWVCEKGDVIEVPLSDARRMIARAMARELPEHPLPKATPAEAEAARTIEVETVRRIVDRKAKLEKAVRVRPLVRKTASEDLAVQDVSGAGREE